MLGRKVSSVQQDILSKSDGDPRGLPTSCDMHANAVTKLPSSKKKTLIKTSRNHEKSGKDVVLDDIRGLVVIYSADYISINAPLNYETLGMVGQKKLA